MRRYHLFIIALALVVMWGTLVAATTTPPAPASPPLPLILGVERISPTVWAVLLHCSYPPYDLYVWTGNSTIQRPKALIRLAEAHWQAQFTGTLPKMATLYGCGQQAAFVVTYPTIASPSEWIVGIGLVGAGACGMWLMWRRRPKPARPSAPAPLPAWSVHLHDDQGERTITLPHGLFSIGSDPACHLIVLGADIALRHAHLMVSETTVHIVDLASPSGVFSGPVRQRLRPHTPVPVDNNDIWLGTSVRLRLSRAQVTQPLLNHPLSAHTQKDRRSHP